MHPTPEWGKFTNTQKRSDWGEGEEGFLPMGMKREGRGE
jgi:hypothetical protein